MTALDEAEGPYNRLGSAEGTQDAPELVCTMATFHCITVIQFPLATNGNVQKIRGSLKANPVV